MIASMMDHGMVGRRGMTNTFLAGQDGGWEVREQICVIVGKMLVS